MLAFYFIPWFSDNFILSIFRSMTRPTIHLLLLFGNIKIVRFLMSVIVDCSIYSINYPRAPILEKSFCWSFQDVIQSVSSHENYEVHVQIFSSLVEILFLLALATMLVLIAWLAILRKFPHECFCFLSWHSYFDDLPIFDKNCASENVFNEAVYSLF